MGPLPQLLTTSLACIQVVALNLTAEPLPRTTWSAAAAKAAVPVASRAARAALQDLALQDAHLCAYVRRHGRSTVLVSGRFSASRGQPQNRQRGARRAVCVRCVRATTRPFR